MCESRGGRAGLQLLVPKNPCGLCGRKATLNLNFMQYTEFRSCVKVSRGGRPGAPVLNSPRGLVWT